MTLKSWNLFTCDEDGILLLEVNRMLRAGGYFVWAAQPVYKHEEALEEQWEGIVDTSFHLDCICWNILAMVLLNFSILLWYIFDLDLSQQFDCYSKQNFDLLCSPIMFIYNNLLFFCYVSYMLWLEEKHLKLYSVK